VTIRLPVLFSRNKAAAALPTSSVATIGSGRSGGARNVGNPPSRMAWATIGAQFSIK
jgi:hypothetical protein